MTRVFDTYNRPTFRTGLEYIALTGEAIAGASLTATREFVDFAVLAPYSQPLSILWAHMILLDGQSAANAILPRGTNVQRVTYMNGATVRITMYSNAGAQVSQVSFDLAATTMENNLGQHTIPAGGRMHITLRNIVDYYPVRGVTPALYMYVAVPPTVWSTPS